MLKYVNFQTIDLNDVLKMTLHEVKLEKSVEKTKFSPLKKGMKPTKKIKLEI